MKDVLKRFCQSFLLSALVLVSLNAHAGFVTFTGADLASGNPVTVGGITVATTTDGGDIGFIDRGEYQGLWLGEDHSSARYTLVFSEMIDFIEIAFTALSSTGPLPVETLSNFTADSSPVHVHHTNIDGTRFENNTIISTINKGVGFFNYSGLFSAFSFDHDQGQQSGFVIERISVRGNGAAVVPEPPVIWLFLPALVLLPLVSRKYSS
ncbi:hypothetical protein SG34_031005 [Thalassomonas viridans]|uniref:PEP-CTERM protein-sorting domain-containing protein n=1 Tax=Thalassomonas viridans TaxID=137584 RepID=A0AAF0CEF4_9GAMM|nr:hypothetical protein [Thalassomonas viridans]WDE09195.1 hypothetical protein SG34_031005 [Thalassomonas viridans]